MLSMQTSSNFSSGRKEPKKFSMLGHLCSSATDESSLSPTDRAASVNSKHSLSKTIKQLTIQVNFQNQPLFIPVGKRCKLFCVSYALYVSYLHFEPDFYLLVLFPATYVHCVLLLLKLIIQTHLFLLQIFLNVSKSKSTRSLWIDRCLATQLLLAQCHCCEHYTFSQLWIVGLLRL